MTNAQRQKKFRDEMKANGYVLKWIPKKLWVDIMKLIKDYRG